MNIKDEVKWGERILFVLGVLLVLVSCMDLESLFDYLGVGCEQVKCIRKG